MENNTNLPEENNDAIPSSELEEAVLKFLKEKDDHRKQAKDINAAREQQQRGRFNDRGRPNDRRRF